MILETKEHKRQKKKDKKRHDLDDPISTRNQTNKILTCLQCIKCMLRFHTTQVYTSIGNVDQYTWYHLVLYYTLDIGC